MAGFVEFLGRGRVGHVGVASGTMAEACLQFMRANGSKHKSMIKFEAELFVPLVNVSHRPGVGLRGGSHVSPRWANWCRLRNAAIVILGQHYNSPTLAAMINIAIILCAQSEITYSRGRAFVLPRNVAGNIPGPWLSPL